MVTKVDALRIIVIGDPLVRSVYGLAGNLSV